MVVYLNFNVKNVNVNQQQCEINKLSKDCVNDKKNILL